MTIQSVERALQILALFSLRNPTLGVTEISQTLKPYKGTVHGLISDVIAKINFKPFTSNTLTNKMELLEDLKLTVRRGYAIDREESVKGLGCIAAPIFQADGTVTGSVSLAGRVQKILGNKLGFYTDELIKTTEEISHDLGNYSNLADAAGTV